MSDMRHPRSCSAFALLVLLSGCTGPQISRRSDELPAWLTPWAEFSVRPSLAASVTETTVHIGNLPFAGEAGRSEQWFRKTTTPFGAARRVQWTDTRTCAAARTVLSNMYALEMPRPAEGGVLEVHADGVVYALSTDGEYSGETLARLSMSSSGGTPLAQWADRSLAELGDCWSDLPPGEVRQAPPPRPTLNVRNGWKADIGHCSPSSMTDARQFNVMDPEGRLLCPACGFPDYAGQPAYDDKEGIIGTTICPCCFWQPGFDDNPAASAAAQDTILGSLRAYRTAWNGGDTLQWRGRLAERPAQWEPEAQLEHLFQVAPNVR